MTTEVNEFDGTYGSPTEQDMPSGGVEITTDDSPDGSIALSNPVSNTMDPSSVYVTANSINAVSYVNDSTIVAFDVVFSVSCVEPDSGATKTYQVVKRIGVDKMKMVNDAKVTTPVSVVEAKAPAVQQESVMTAARIKALAGIK
jgi:hypothetical protein